MIRSRGSEVGVDVDVDVGVVVPVVDGLDVASGATLSCGRAAAAFAGETPSIREPQ